jgi:Pectate lyase superfamily protein/Right handed beta helix region
MTGEPDRDLGKVSGSDRAPAKRPVPDRAQPRAPRSRASREGRRRTAKSAALGHPAGTEPAGENSNVVDWLNVVTMYGADPTGANDSTAAIQNALNAAGPGQPVYLPAGTYMTSAPLQVPPGGVLHGDFANENSEYAVGHWGSIIQPAASWSQGSCPANGVIAVLGQAGLGDPPIAYEHKLYGLMIDCQYLPRGSATDGVQFYGNTWRPHLERVLLMRPPGNGVNYVFDPGGNSPDAVRLNRVNVRYPGLYGFNHYRISDCTYIDCLVENGLSDGFHITNAANGTFIGCRSEHNAGDGYAFVCTNSATGSGGVRFLGCSTDNCDANGISITSTNNSGVPVQLTGCTFRRDGYNGGDGGGGYAGVYISAYPGTVHISGCAVWPGVEDDGTGPNIPEIGMVLSGNTPRTYVIVGASYIQGASTAISDDGSAGGVCYGMDVLAATGTTSYPSVQGPRQGSATLSGGTVAVPCTSVTDNSKIFLTNSTLINPGFLQVSALIPGESFTVTSSSDSDNSSFFWQIMNP